MLWRVEWVFAAPSIDLANGGSQLSNEELGTVVAMAERDGPSTINVEEARTDNNDVAATAIPRDGPLGDEGAEEGQANMEESLEEVQEGEDPEEDLEEEEEEGVIDDEAVDLTAVKNAGTAAAASCGPVLLRPPPLIPASDYPQPVASSSSSIAPPALRLVDERLPEDEPLITALEAHLKYRPGSAVRHHALR